MTGATEPRVLHCKNNGMVRATRNAEGTATLYNGAIAGLFTSSGVDRYVKDCGVGGKLARYNISSGAWFSLEPLDGTRSFRKYIYSTEVSVEKLDVFAPGCEYWDGRSKLSWEE